MLFSKINKFVIIYSLDCKSF